MSVSLTEVSNGAWRLPCLELAAVLGNGKWFNSRWVLCLLSVRPAEEKLPGAHPEVLAGTSTVFDGINLETSVLSSGKASQRALQIYGSGDMERLQNNIHF